MGAKYTVGMWGKGYFHVLRLKYIMESNRATSIIFKTFIPFHPAISVLRIYPIEIKPLVSIKLLKYKHSEKHVQGYLSVQRCK